LNTQLTVNLCCSFVCPWFIFQQHLIPSRRHRASIHPLHIPQHELITRLQGTPSSKDSSKRILPQLIQLHLPLPHCLFNGRIPLLLLPSLLLLLLLPGQLWRLLLAATGSCGGCIAAVGCCGCCCFLLGLFCL
jgi:hypothetical protein